MCPPLLAITDSHSSQVLILKTKLNCTPNLDKSNISPFLYVEISLSLCKLNILSTIGLNLEPVWCNFWELSINEPDSSMTLTTSWVGSCQIFLNHSHTLSLFFFFFLSFLLLFSLCFFFFPRVSFLFLFNVFLSFSTFISLSRYSPPQ